MFQARKFLPITLYFFVSIGTLLQVEPVFGKTGSDTVIIDQMVSVLKNVSSFGGYIVHSQQDLKFSTEICYLKLEFDDIGSDWYIEYSFDFYKPIEIHYSSGLRAVRISNGGGIELKRTRMLLVEKIAQPSGMTYLDEEGESKMADSLSLRLSSGMGLTFFNWVFNLNKKCMSLR